MTPRQAAKASGKTHYFTGKSCHRGHIAKRFVATAKCVLCAKEEYKQWASSNTGKIRGRMRIWRAANREKIREYWRKARPKSLARERIKQGLPVPTRPVSSTCEICGRAPQGKALALDHCHKQGIFRGWLCTQCNLGLAMFKDDPVAFLAAFRYLAQSQMPHIQLIELTPEQAVQRGLQ